MKGIKIDPKAKRIGTATVATPRGVRLETLCDLDAPAYQVRPAAVLPYPLVVPVWGVRTKSEANQREHWAARHRRFKGQRLIVGRALEKYREHLSVFGWEVKHHGAGLTVILTRIGARKLDSDNLAGALKAVRDEVAEWLGVDDGHARLDWIVDQRRGEDGVIVAVYPAA